MVRTCGRRNFPHLRDSQPRREPGKEEEPQAVEGPEEANTMPDDNDAVDNLTGFMHSLGSRLTFSIGAGL